MKIQKTTKNLTMIILLGTAALLNEAKAQSKSPIHVGFKGGSNFSNLSLSGNNVDTKYSVGYHGGVFTRLDISKLYLQGELLYAHKESKIEGASISATKAKWNSIGVPLLIGYKVFESENLALRIFGGGVYSYIINDKASILSQVSQSFKEFDKSNIGYQAGAGVDFGRLSLDLKYEGSLTKISKEFKGRPNSFQASIGFSIF